MRDGTTSSLGRRQLGLQLARAAGQQRSRGSTVGVEVDLQRADAGGDVDDARQARAPRAPASARARASAGARSSIIGAVLDEQVVVAVARGR